jgi:hypothetical protein
VDLTEFRVGDIVVVPEAVAAMLVKEGWAEHVADTHADEDSGKKDT